ncbi:MAG: glycosyltransferase family 2 protein [Actinomycetota bacterium]
MDHLTPPMKIPNELVPENRLSSVSRAPRERVAISVVVPVYNEEKCLGELSRRLIGTLEAMGEPYEVILVNDGSRDSSLERMIELHHEDPRLKVLNLSRNFGHQIAVTAGMDFSSGEAVILMDADLQDIPELIPELYDRYREGYDVVYAIRAKRDDESAFKLVTAKLFYRLFRWATDITMPMDTGDFRLMSRRVVDAVSRMRERHRMLRAMVSWVGFRQTGVSYERPGRFAGETKYPFRKMLRFAMDGLSSFSTLPLRVSEWLGLGVSAFSFLYAVYAVISHVAGKTTEGWTSLMVALTFIGGVQLLCMGILGEYLGRIYEEAKGRPLYLVAEFYDQPSEA